MSASYIRCLACGAWNAISRDHCHNCRRSI